MSDYGVTDITASALSDFRNRLEDDDGMALEYLVRKMGFDAQDETETNMAYDVYKDKDLLSNKKLKTGEYICQMHKSSLGSEFDACCDEANSAELVGSDVLIEQLLLQI